MKNNKKRKYKHAICIIGTHGFKSLHIYRYKPRRSKRAAKKGQIRKALKYEIINDYGNKIPISERLLKKLFKRLPPKRRKKCSQE